MGTTRAFRPDPTSRMEGNTGEPDTGEPDAESLRVFREVLGAFKSFVPAAVAARRLEADPVFARHIALDLSLPAELALESVNPGWEQVTVHAFMLRPDLAVRLNSQLRKVALGLERAGGGLQLRNAAARAARAAHRDEEGSRADRPTQPTSLWANVSRSGHYHGLHDHADATWSGVYYVQVPPAGADYSGRIAFRTAVGGVPGGILAAQAGRRAFAMDPQRPEGWCAYAHVDPSPGMLLVFPSWLLHCVMPVVPMAGAAKSRCRISYSFNFGEL